MELSGAYQFLLYITGGGATILSCWGSGLLNLDCVGGSVGFQQQCAKLLHCTNYCLKRFTQQGEFIFSCRGHRRKHGAENDLFAFQLVDNSLVKAINSVSSYQNGAFLRGIAEAFSISRSL